MSTEPSAPPTPRLPAKPEPTKPKRSGMASGAMAAAGIAAGVAATLGVSELTGALGDDAAAPEPGLDDAVFDEVAGPAGGGAGGGGASGGGGGPGGGGGGGGGPRAAGRPTARPPAPDDDAPSRPARPDVAATSAVAADVDGPDGDAFERARQRVLSSLDDWQAPDGADPDEAAALRAELADRVARFVPADGQSVDDAIASLRDEVDQQVKDFAQDERIEAIVDELRADDADSAELHDDFDETVVHAMPWDDPATEHDERQGLPEEAWTGEDAALPDVVGDTPPAAEPLEPLEPAEPAEPWPSTEDDLAPGGETPIWIEPWLAPQDDPANWRINEAPAPDGPDASTSEPADGGSDTWDVPDVPSTTDHDELPADEPAMG